MSQPQGLTPQQYQALLADMSAAWLSLYNFEIPDTEENVLEQLQQNQQNYTAALTQFSNLEDGVNDHQHPSNGAIIEVNGGVF